MQGSRPLNDEEIKSVLEQNKTPRFKALFITGIRTGFRISELLSFTIKDVMQYGNIRDVVTVTRANMKGKTYSRSVPLHKQAQQALLEHISAMENKNPDTKLFDFSRQYAHKILKEAVHAAKITGKVSTHSMRKSFANKVHAALGENIFKTQKALGHKSVSSTASYLSFKQDEINAAITGE